MQPESLPLPPVTGDTSLAAAPVIIPPHHVVGRFAARKRRLIAFYTTLAILILTIFGFSRLDSAPRHYPLLVFQAADEMQVTYLQESQHTRSQCDATLQRTAQAITANCSICRVQESRCLDSLNPLQRKILNGRPLDVPVLRMSEGAAAFVSVSPSLALAACQESERNTARALLGHAQCAPAAFESISLSLIKLGVNSITEMPPTRVLLGITLFALIFAFLICYLIIRSDKLHGRFSHDEVATGPHKSHTTPTARIGGLALAAAILASVFILHELHWPSEFAADGLTMLTAIAMLVFAGGFAEDITKRFGVLARLTLTMCAGAFASLLVGATLDRLAVPGLDELLQWPLFAIAFTAFAVGGVANAVNIIDGFNGVAGGYAVLVLAALAWVATQVADPVVLSGSLVMLGALLGFLIWNYPHGKLFLGDGGAYLVGFWLAELSVLLVTRNPDVSPWFPLLLLSYPIYETLFSIYRKKVLRGSSPSQPDGLHFQMLIYRRMVRFHVCTGDPALKMARNSLVAAYLWIMSILFFIPALIFWNQTAWLATAALIFCLCYNWLYWRMAKWKSPTPLLIQRN